MKIVMEAEDLLQDRSPRASMPTLRNCMQAAKGTELLWLMRTMFDLIVQDPGRSWATRVLKPKKADKGYIDLLLFKAKLKESILNNELDLCHEIKSGEKAKLLYVLSSIASYRAVRGYRQGLLAMEKPRRVDLCHRQNLGNTADQFFTLAESIVYSEQHEDHLFTVVKRRRSAKTP